MQKIILFNCETGDVVMTIEFNGTLDEADSFASDLMKLHRFEGHDCEFE